MSSRHNDQRVDPNFVPAPPCATGNARRHHVRRMDHSEVCLGNPRRAVVHDMAWTCIMETQVRMTCGPWMVDAALLVIRHTHTAAQGSLPPRWQVTPRCRDDWRTERTYCANADSPPRFINGACDVGGVSAPAEGRLSAACWIARSSATCERARSWGA